MLPRLVVLLSLAVALALPAVAGQYRGHLRGRILDAAGKPLSGIAMRITSETTNESRRFVSGSGGRYTVADLMPGTYRIEAEDDAFRAFAVRTSVAVNHDAELDLHLGASSITMSADVRPTLVPVDRHSPALTTRLDPALLQHLPFEGRNYLDAALLTAGIVPGAYGVVAGGTPEGFTGYLLDGLTWFVDPSLGTVPARAQLDAISEFEVLTSTYDASFGRAAGAQLNLVTKGGTNRLQGGAVGLLQPDGDRALIGGFAGGPLAVDRTFAFGNYEYAQVDGAIGRSDDGHVLGGRVDHLLKPSSRLTGRYGLDTQVADGDAQNAAVALHSALGNSLTNEVRLGWSRMENSDNPVELIASAMQLATVSTWARGTHLVRGGADIYRQSWTAGATDVSANAVGLFVQDDWWFSRSLSLSAGLRYDRSSPEDDGDDSNRVSPRLGFTWSPGASGQNLVRAGYGINHNQLLVSGPPPRLDQWSVAFRRGMGRARALEGAYLGSRGEDLLAGAGTSRYHAMRITFEERSEANVSALVTYTYGKWTEDFGFFDERVRSPLDSRHRFSGAFVAVLPFGKDRRWFSGGLAASILGNMELSGIYTLQTGRPLAGLPLEQGPSYRNLDLALLKTLLLQNQRTLQLRIETYNLTDREPAPRGRRFQLGGRIMF